MRSIVPALLVLVLLGLVLLVPERDAAEGDSGFVVPGSAAAGRDVATALFTLPALDLTEPPPWATQRGDDEIQRLIDRLAWGNHDAVVRAREQLARHRGQLYPELLSRLRALGHTDPIVTSKLIAVLGEEGSAPEVIDELTRAALSESALVSKAALRALAFIPVPEALGGILQRLHDDVPEVRTQARAALVHRVRGGDEEAIYYLVEDVQRNAATPDPHFLQVLGEVPADENVLRALRTVVERAGYEPKLTALSCLLVHGDEETKERVAEMIRSGDQITRVNAMRMTALARVVLAVDTWESTASFGAYQDCLNLMSVLVHAIRSGHDEAPLAYDLLELMAADPGHNAQAEALNVLFKFENAFAVDRTRLELQQGVGAWLGVTVDRIVGAGQTAAAAEMVAVALERLEDPALGDDEEVLLLRLLANIDPASAAHRIAEHTREPGRMAEDMLPMLSLLGGHGLSVLSDHVDTDRGAAVYVYAAAQVGDPMALPVLEAIVLDEALDPMVRQHALDAVARLRSGPREDSLRQIALALDDPSVSERARLLFWNYL